MNSCSRTDYGTYLMQSALNKLSQLFLDGYSKIENIVLLIENPIRYLMKYFQYVFFTTALQYIDHEKIS